MNTFLPYPGFTASAQVLDRQRLGKQRVECLQLYRALTGRSTGWRNHPAARMWRGHLAALMGYGLAVCREWQRRGYSDTCEFKLVALSLEDGLLHSMAPPAWCDKAFCLAHQSNLLRKNPEFCRPVFGEHVPDNLPYLWPA